MNKRNYVKGFEKAIWTPHHQPCPQRQGWARTTPLLEDYANCPNHASRKDEGFSTRLSAAGHRRRRIERQRAFLLARRGETSAGSGTMEGVALKAVPGGAERLSHGLQDETNPQDEQREQQVDYVLVKTD